MISPPMSSLDILLSVAWLTFSLNFINLTTTNKIKCSHLIVQLSKHGVGPAFQFIRSPSVDHTLRLDVLGFLYNMLTEVESSRLVAVKSGSISVLWGIVKSQNDEKVLELVGRLVKEICSTAEDPDVHKLLMNDHIMRILLKLAKIEVPQLKLDIACCIYDMTKAESGETLSVLKWDGMDVLFWLTLHDCMNLNNAIKENVALALRNMTATSETGAVSVASEERVMPVMRALSKSHSEDVLKHVAGAIFNLMSVSAAKALLLKQGLIALIFDLAKSGEHSESYITFALFLFLLISSPSNV